MVRLVWFIKSIISKAASKAIFKLTTLNNPLLEKNLINIDDLTYALLSEKLETIIEKREYITEHLNKKNQALHSDFLNSMNGVMNGLS